MLEVTINMAHHLLLHATQPFVLVTFLFSMLRRWCHQKHSQVCEVSGLDAGVDVDIRPAVPETAATVCAAVASLIVASAATIHAILIPAITAMPSAVRPAAVTLVQRLSVAPDVAST